MEECDELSAHVQNSSRLAALMATALLDSPTEASFDRLTRLASLCVHAPVALVTLVDKDRQFFKSCLGLPEPWQSRRETPLSHSFCQHNRIPRQPLVITDARTHPVFQDNPAIRDLKVIAYLGIPLVTSDNYVLGSFCVIDSRPREWTAEEITIVEGLAEGVMTEINLRVEISSRREAEEELQRQNQKLQQAYRELETETAERLRALEQLRQQEQLLIRQGRLAAMGEMIANVAHHWRQPLNNLALLAQELPVTYGSTEFSADYLADMARKMVKLVTELSGTLDDFRFFFRPSATQVEFSANELVKRALALLQGTLEDGGISVSVVEREKVSVTGYPNEFCQVIVNLLLNARDALLGGREGDRKIDIEIGKEGDRSMVSVADNAGGIPEAIVEKIFDPYFTTKGPNRGSGLGLYMAKITIEKNMGGSLAVANVNGGARFRIVL